ncbi:hypothetical protein [Flavobacterium sp.]|uniref:hypothetical protein n=1 Tax=Flavobacterium sp. TaxID=239 RepID=UPI0022C60DCE|nr:hypothetical protein [Flavobacterium sp.]MCZ8145773.1 hypothetical protein [Flavobacterium sp.]MCZ8367413.1 hypothetical protein [Flavobacterium sp.]
MAHVKTFGEFCDYISNKIKLENQESCTKQQAFNKLREAFSTILLIDRKSITPSLPLNQIFPRKNRRLVVKKLENNLGFELNILRAPNWITATLTITLLVSLVMVFFSGRIGTAGIIISICCLWLSSRFGKEFDVKTVREVVEKMTRENYLKSRRDPTTFNKTEIEAVLINWFAEDLELEKSGLTREATFR